MSNLQQVIRAVFEAEDRRLDPPAELEADDCETCAGTGQVTNPEFGAELFDCAVCDGSGKAKALPVDECRCRGDVCYC